MSNYGPPPGSGDQNPYGQQPPQYGAPQQGAPQYGAPQYGAPGGGQTFGSEPAKTDGMSIAAFVSSLVCCAPVGLVLGFIGLGRTKNGQRKGRWAAVLGIVLGFLGLGAWVIGGIGVAGGISWLNSVVTPDNAEVGQCVDIDEEDNTVTMTEKECTEEHDGEIVAKATVDDDNRADITEQMSLYCQTLLSEEDLAVLNEHPDLEYNSVIEDPENIENGDHLVCYVESDEKLTEPLL